ncbi:MAG: CHASE2 domain-containing protein [Verrucomicrobia bacterium]|nr:CHASE2 domain-containing protein [Verrucomicrobiota bacterium]
MNGERIQNGRHQKADAKKHCFFKRLLYVHGIHYPAEIVKLKGIRKHKLFSSMFGAALTVFCGLVLWATPLGERWKNASYDYLFRFGSSTVTNKVVLILMDNDAYNHFPQERGQPWDRALHAQVLNRLADDGCALVVFDSFFRIPRDPVKDEALAGAMRRQHRVVLMAEQAAVTYPTLAGAHPALPSEPFLSAAGTNWGVAWLDPDLDSTVRRHWPFPVPGPYPSLPWTAARLSGAQLSESPHEQWLRYYGPNGAWATLSYRFALTQPTNYYRDKIVFIGTQPRTSVAGDEPDEFRTPYTHWTGESMGGVQIMVTSFLNLMNGDWLRRSASWMEALALLTSGILLGGILCRMRPLIAGIFAMAFALVIALGSVSWSHFTNYWFPWLVISAGQVPCALVWALATQKSRAPRTALETTGSAEEMPDTPDYELLHPPFGKGAYGKVWLARNAIGQWQALKVVYLANFGDDADPYEREFNGIKRYKPVSDKHPGLLRVDFVSQKKPAGYFFYVMELGDPLEVDWERKPSTYKPRDLVSERRRARGQKLPVRECVRIGLALADALDFLHRQGLTHRDIKPQNIIFVDGRPKLADMGLIAEIRPPDQKHTYVGTPGYMPPPPESPGTPQADIYALGMLLYVLSTGRNPTFFPELSTTLAESSDVADFFRLNPIILKACHSDCAQRYASAAKMHSALQEAHKALEGQSRDKVPGMAQRTPSRSRT